MLLWLVITLIVDNKYYANIVCGVTTLFYLVNNVAGDNEIKMLVIKFNNNIGCVLCETIFWFLIIIWDWNCGQTIQCQHFVFVCRIFCLRNNMAGNHENKFGNTNLHVNIGYGFIRRVPHALWNCPNCNCGHNVQWK